MVNLSKCRICERETRIPTRDGHCLEKSPIDPGLCLGCWVASIATEKFLYQTTQNVGIGSYVKVEEHLKALIAEFGGSRVLE